MDQRDLIRDIPLTTIDGCAIEEAPSGLQPRGIDG